MRHIFNYTLCLECRLKRASNYGNLACVDQDTFTFPPKKFLKSRQTIEHDFCDAYWIDNIILPSHSICVVDRYQGYMILLPHLLCVYIGIV